MAGHNKWAQIKRQKEKTDVVKSKLFGKLAKLITDEARKANGVLSSPGLKVAIEKAKAENMPNDNIERAIKRATGSDTQAMERIMYECYGPGGCGLLIEALTANKNKAAQEIKHILSKHGFTLAGIGSVVWAFEKNQNGEWVAATPVELSDGDISLLATIIEELESCDEVHAVHTNAS